MPPVLSRYAPSRDLGTDPGAVSMLAFSRSVQEPQTRLTPPHAGHRLASNRVAARHIPEGMRGPPGFDAVSMFRRLTPAQVSPHERLWNVFLVPT
jgi:hypothetical protein